ncbi:MAG: PAS domain-containing sensor histidine kinase [Flavobacteriaceae bacterium]
MKFKIATTLFFFFVLAVAGVAMGGYFVMKGYPFTATFFFVTALILMYATHDFIKGIFLRTSQTLMAMAHGDLSVMVPKKKLPRSIAEPLENILVNSKETRIRTESIRIIYESIIDTMDTGILILRAGDSHIFYSNKAFFQILELPKFSNWEMAKRHLGTFDTYLKEQNWNTVRDVINLKVNGKEQAFSLRTFTSQIYGANYLMVNLDPIQNIIDRKEKEAWFNLMRVMSHEIINTIAPISSLTSNLEYLVSHNKEGLGANYEDIHTSIATIHKRAGYLLDFVDTYRLLTELPTPKPEKALIRDLFHDNTTILSSLFNEKNILVDSKVEPENLTFYLDKKQMGQVIINLLTNSVYALENCPDPQINLRAYRMKNQLVIQVTDNGHGIKDSIKKEVFVPFFTTRKNGSGIGLSLSKNIIQAHNGFISFNSQNGFTTFRIQFPYKNI